MTYWGFMYMCFCMGIEFFIVHSSTVMGWMLSRDTSRMVGNVKTRFYEPIAIGPYTIQLWSSRALERESRCIMHKVSFSVYHQGAIVNPLSDRVLSRLPTIDALRGQVLSPACWYGLYFTRPVLHTMTHIP